MKYKHTHKLFLLMRILRKSCKIPIFWITRSDIGRKIFIFSISQENELTLVHMHYLTSNSILWRVFTQKRGVLTILIFKCEFYNKVIDRQLFLLREYLIQIETSFREYRCTLFSSSDYVLSTSIFVSVCLAISTKEVFRPVLQKRTKQKQTSKTKNTNKRETNQQTNKKIILDLLSTSKSWLLFVYS